MAQKDIYRIVMLSDAEYAAHLSALEAAERDALVRYQGVNPRWPAKPGSPQMAGLGTQIGGFVGQEAFLAAQNALRDARRVREGLDDAWTFDGASDGNATFSYRFGGPRGPLGIRGGFGVQIHTYGVDVTGCRTPVEAMRRIDAQAAVEAR